MAPSPFQKIISYLDKRGGLHSSILTQCLSGNLMMGCETSCGSKTMDFEQIFNLPLQRLKIKINNVFHLYIKNTSDSNTYQSVRTLSTILIYIYACYKKLYSCIVIACRLQFGKLFQENNFNINVQKYNMYLIQSHHPLKTIHVFHISALSDFYNLRLTRMLQSISPLFKFTYK